MGNSTTTLQMIVDSVSAAGDLRPILINTAGYSNEPAVTIANDVMMEVIGEHFPWKWNRFKLKPFYINSRQQDYPTVNEDRIGWLENGFRVYVNSPWFPPAVSPIECVRDLKVSRVDAGWPVKACWFPNDQLEWGRWPGPNIDFIDPHGRPNTPFNPWTAIELDDGSLLLLTKYGVTGATKPVIPPAPPDAPDNYPIGLVITDGTVEWTVCNPKAQGIRLYPMPPFMNANIWAVRLFAQHRAPVIKNLGDFIEPFPDDQVKWFRDGFITYCHKYSDNDRVRARYPQMRAEWFESMIAETKQGNREEEAYSFYPDRSLLSPNSVSDPGPGNPFSRFWGGM